MPLSLSDEPLVDVILDHLRSYSLAVDGVPKMTGGARHFLTALPPDCDQSQKHVFAVMEDEQPVGLVDLINGYPVANIAYIGLLAIVEYRQHRGLGRAVYRLLEDFVRCRLHSSKIRLAVVASNPVHEFWRRMGFRETGEFRSYKGEALTSTVSMMEKPLTRSEHAPN